MDVFGEVGMSWERFQSEKSAVHETGLGCVCCFAVLFLCAHFLLFCALF